MAQYVIDSPPEVVYPDSDGKPMGETGIHVHTILNTYGALWYHFEGTGADIYVAANMFMYYEQGNPRAVVAPDVFVVRGTHREHRRSYRLWEEGKGPDFVLEVTSRSTRTEDLVTKREVYRSLGVEEYCQFDPLGEYLTPQLQGLRLRDGDYEPIAVSELHGGGLALSSAVLNLDLRVEDGDLRVHDPATGRFIRDLNTLGEEALTHRETKGRLQQLETARQAAQERIKELEDRLRSLGIDPDSRA